MLSIKKKKGVTSFVLWMHIRVRNKELPQTVQQDMLTRLLAKEV